MEGGQESGMQKFDFTIAGADDARDAVSSVSTGVLDVD